MNTKKSIQEKYKKYKTKYLKAKSKMEATLEDISPIDFINVSDNTLNTLFINSLANSNNENLNALAKIIRQEKMINLKFAKSKIDNTDVYMVMISCHLDNILIKYGKEYKFPNLLLLYQ